MRGKTDNQMEFLPVISVEQLVAERLPKEHPLFYIKKKTDEVLTSISDEIDALYPSHGRASIPPEYLLRALLWQALYSIRSERQLIQHLHFDILCQWFVGLPMSRIPWNATTFSKNRSELFKGRLNVLAQRFFGAHLEFLREAGLISSDHLSVDGTQLGAWASQKSFIAKSDLDEGGRPPTPPGGGRNGWVDFKGEKRSNETHVSATDPDARLASKGGAAKLCHELNVLSENRNNYAIGFEVRSPSGKSEREAAYEMIVKECKAGRRPETVGGDKNYSNGDELIEELIDLGIVPHFPSWESRPESLAHICCQTEGYTISFQKRMRIEEIMGYIKGVCGLAKLKVRGVVKVMGVAAVSLSAYNLMHEARLTTG